MDPRRIAPWRATPVLAEDFRGPTRTVVDRPLVAGAALFGIGWGLVGYYPGPALASLSLGRTETGIFVVAMLAGMAAYRLFAALTSVNRRKAPASV